MENFAQGYVFTGNQEIIPIKQLYLEGTAIHSFERGVKIYAGILYKDTKFQKIAH